MCYNQLHKRVRSGRVEDLIIVSSVDKIAQPSDKTAPASRPWWAALLLSTLAHLLLVVLLSLIVMGSASDALRRALVVRQSEELSQVESTTTFDFKPETISPQEEEQVQSLTPLMSVDLSLPTPSFTPPIRESEASPASTGEAPSTEASGQSVLNTAKLATAIQRRVSQAGGKQGEVQFALAWKNVNDVDLHVIAPSGERISHLHKRSVCQGMLDVDMNVRGDSEEPVENVRWISDAPWGRYTVMINLFRIHRPLEGSRVYRGSEFQLLVQLGSESSIETETVSRGQQLAVFRYQYVPQTLSAAQREQLLSELNQLQIADESIAGPLLQRAIETKTEQLRDRLLNNIIIQFPHTDAAIEAMRMLGGNVTK